MKVAGILGPRLSSSQRAARALRDDETLLHQLAGSRPDHDLHEEVAHRYGTNRAYLFKVKAIHAQRPDLLDPLCDGKLTIPQAEAIVRGSVYRRQPVGLRQLKEASALIKQARNSLRGTTGYADLAPHFGALMESLTSHMRRCIASGRRRRVDHRGAHRRGRG